MGVVEYPAACGENCAAASAWRAAFSRLRVLKARALAAHRSQVEPAAPWPRPVARRILPEFLAPEEFFFEYSHAAADSPRANREPHFQPINAPDMQRVRMSLQFYRAHGWEPVVLCVKRRRRRRDSRARVRTCHPTSGGARRVRAAGWLATHRHQERCGLRCWLKFLLTGAQSSAASASTSCLFFQTRSFCHLHAAASGARARPAQVSTCRTRGAPIIMRPPARAPAGGWNIKSRPDGLDARRLVVRPGGAR